MRHDGNAYNETRRSAQLPSPAAQTASGAKFALWYTVGLAVAALALVLAHALALTLALTLSLTRSRSQSPVSAPVPQSARIDTASPSC